mmetsp:Transcript_67657/g.113596  ORF Transcript_67657/g.113596 Transcript_67657/m.113596 type:complete len:85 (-) Transcript_67657:549-803(-)|eukprot:CAMPEP_0174292606 /NCGR_PEP_ID=MMETSP0809-20121228/36035_1 /TAXON_ID=73025 ORGANISM="Eutreptiella gymnastica-like, Strain CCMP1594" /NCGR_SAMPLE_ID=MMETSP0809 /ASSEMBLY_ACC=CAM_ASM_000658 /LENGTH=84 /DNA_ID=CAMNT_0015392809 /DNA_START=105 /DNA_END=359 /DNA_ORIENTATION=+
MSQAVLKNTTQGQIKATPHHCRIQGHANHVNTKGPSPRTTAPRSSSQLAAVAHATSTSRPQSNLKGERPALRAPQPVFSMLLSL